MAQTDSRSNQTHKRRKLAYNVIKRMAIEAGYMKSINDTKGFTDFINAIAAAPSLTIVEIKKK